MCHYGGAGWTTARIGSDGPGDSLRIWPPCACLSFDVSPGFASFDLSLGRRAGLARRVDLIRLKMQNGPIRLMRSGAIPRYEAY